MKKIVMFCFAVAFILCLTLSVSASETLTASMDKDSCTAGEYIRVKVEYSGENIGAFLADMQYDPESLRYVRTENDSDDYVKSADSNGILRTVYTVKTNGKGSLFTAVFKVLPTAVKADVSVKLYDIVDSNANSFGPDKSFNLSSAVSIPSGEALLLDLIPSTGELKEDFSPYTTSYTMSVPYEVKSLTFKATVSPGAKCSINRKNLGSGGSVTDFVLTVTSEDEETKNIYTIKVTRGEYVRPSASNTKDEPDEEQESEITPDAEYETVTPEYTGDEIVPDEDISDGDYVPEQSTVIERSETPLKSDGSMIWFLAGAGVCLVCVLAGVLIAKLFGNTGKHGKH